MRQEHSVGDDVAKTNEIMVLNMVSQLLIVLHRNDLPVVVGIVVRVSSDLLTLARNTAVVVSKRIVVLVAVEIGLGLLVSQSNCIVVIDCDGIGQHDVVAQRLLEFGSHEVVSRSRAGEDREVNLEPEEVEDEGHDDQAESTRRKVLTKLRQAQRASRPLDVQQVPQVDRHGRANSDKGEETNVLGRNVARQSEAGQD